jgi:hypothetical protein
MLRILFFLIGFWLVPANAQVGCPYNASVGPWYFSVTDTSPGTTVFATVTGTYVVFADADYVAWLALGCVAPTVPTAAEVYAYLARQAAITFGLAGPSYSAISLTADTALTTYATYSPVTPNADGWKLKVMNARLSTSPAIGGTIKFPNLSASYNFILADSGASTICTVPPNGTAELTLTANSTTGGTWACVVPQTAIVTGGTGSLPNPSSNLQSVGSNATSGTSKVWGVKTGTADQFYKINASGTVNGFETLAGDCAMSSGSIKCQTINGIEPFSLGFSQTVDFNAGNTDTSFTMALPSWATRYLVSAVRISGASHDLSTATAGLFTQAAGAGTAIVTGASAITVTATADGTNNNAQAMTVNNGNTLSYTLSGFPTLYFRVATAEGAAATATVTIQITALP